MRDKADIFGSSHIFNQPFFLINESLLGHSSHGQSFQRTIAGLVLSHGITGITSKRLLPRLASYMRPKRWLKKLLY